MLGFVVGAKLYFEDGTMGVIPAYALVDAAATESVEPRDRREQTRRVDAQLGAETRALQQEIKQTLDPLGILNPGAVLEADLSRAGRTPAE